MEIGIQYIFAQATWVCVMFNCPLPWDAFLGTDDDLEFYIRKCGDILGVTSKLPKEKQDAKNILEYIFFQVVEFKKLNQVFLITELQVNYQQHQPAPKHFYSTCHCYAQAMQQCVKASDVR